MNDKNIIHETEEYGLFIDLEKKNEYISNTTISEENIYPSKKKLQNVYYSYTIYKEEKGSNKEFDFKNIKEKNKYLYNYDHLKLHSPSSKNNNENKNDFYDLYNIYKKRKSIFLFVYVTTVSFFIKYFY